MESDETDIPAWNVRSEIQRGGLVATHDVRQSTEVYVLVSNNTQCGVRHLLLLDRQKQQPQTST